MEVAREKVNLAIDHYVSSATEWHGRRLERQRLLRDGMGLFKVNEQYIADSFPPPRHGLAAQVGLGKTQAYISRLDELVSVLRTGHCIFIGVSNHNLSRELKGRLGELGVEEEIYLGPTQDDPDQSGKTMCLGCSDHQIMAIGGWQTLKEVQRYTKGARKRVLSDDAMDKVQANLDGTKVSNLSPDEGQVRQ